MHISKKIITLITIWIFFFLFWLYFFIISPKYARENMAYLDKNVINIFQNDIQVREIRNYRLLLDNDRPVCNKDSIQSICREKLTKYSEVMEKMPNGTYYNICNGFIIKHYSSGLHYVLILSRPDIIYSGIHLIRSSDGWLKYYLDRDLFNDRGSCYPWDNLEDYWKRYGKASPESIQSVIDGWIKDQ